MTSDHATEDSDTRAKGAAHGRAHPASGRRIPHAIVMMLLIITAAVALTYVVPSGRYQRTKA